MRLFDTHAHLLDARFDADRAELIPALPQEGVCAVVEGCCEAADLPKIAALCVLYDHVYGTAGIHPQSANTAHTQNLLEVERALRQRKIVAVGEIGLDYHYEFAPRDVQKAALHAQLELAAGAQKPVVIHDRDAHGDVMDALRAHAGVHGVMHCYSGSYEDACRYIDMGYYIAFGGALTFKNAVKQRDIAAHLPLERLVIETDCPYMTPEPHRGKRNDPRLICHTLETLAKVRGLSPEEVAEATYQNALALFGLE